MAKKTRKKKENKIRKSKGLHDPNKYFKKTGLRCMEMKVNFTIDKKYLTHAIYELLTYEGEEDTSEKEYKLTRTNVKKRLYRSLYIYGNDWIDKLDYEPGITESVRWEKAEEWAKKLYPAYFESITPNSIRLILED